jgi:hypothetical protein
MFIRWQTYRSKGSLYRGKTTRIRAILSVSIRVDGQSRQKFIAVIGSFVAERLDVEARRDFWKAAHERLSTYVHDDDRSKVEAELARRVPAPTAAEEAAWQLQADGRPDAARWRDDVMPPAIGRVSAP